MPDTPLTKILHEFRAYRPLPHRQFLAHVASKAEQLGVKDFSVRDKETVVLYLKVLDHVRSFRWRHWLFAREYIIRRSPHPTATGGSPIITVRKYRLFPSVFHIILHSPLLLVLLFCGNGAPLMNTMYIANRIQTHSGFPTSFPLSWT
jgi:hypothetical protein